jgi:hypothetical protein
MMHRRNTGKEQTETETRGIRKDEFTGPVRKYELFQGAKTLVEIDDDGNVRTVSHTLDRN